MSLRDFDKVYNNSPLHIAVENDDVQAVTTLLSNSAKLEARNSKGRTPLHGVTNYKIVKDLLAAGADVDALDKEGNTPLHTAILRKCVPIVQILLQAGADVTIKNSYKGDTPLHVAVDPLYRHGTMTQLLVKSGSPVNQQNNFGETPLHIAYKNSTGPIDRNIIKILIDNGADISVKNSAGKKPADHKDNALHDAVRSGESKDITKILMSKTDINFQDIYGRTALCHAVSKPGIEAGVIRNLFTAGADANIADAVNSSPLHQAVILGNISIVRLLLNAGAVVNKQNNDGDTPLHLAVKAGSRKAFRHYAAIVKVLIDHKTDLTLKNNAGKTAAECAVLDNIKKLFA